MSLSKHPGPHQSPQGPAVSSPYFTLPLPYSLPVPLASSLFFTYSKTLALGDSLPETPFFQSFSAGHLLQRVLP